MEIGVFPIVGEAEDGNRHFLSFRAGENPKALSTLRERGAIFNRGNSRKIEVYKAVTISPKRRPGALLWGPRAHWGCAVVLGC